MCSGKADKKRYGVRVAGCGLRDSGYELQVARFVVRVSEPSAVHRATRNEQHDTLRVECFLMEGLYA